MTATLVYLMVYAFMQLGAFAIVVLLRREDAVGDELKDLSGLYFRRPGAAVAMLLFMLSLGGIPPTAGFMGKFWLFGAAIESGYVWLAVIGVLNSAISLYYYVRVVVFMWIKEDATGAPVPPGARRRGGARDCRGRDDRVRDLSSAAVRDRGAIGRRARPRGRDSLAPVVSRVCENRSPSVIIERLCRTPNATSCRLVL